MTNITVYKTESGEYSGFVCMGHAGYAKHPSEKDIVCASVSVLVINTINSLDQLTEDKIHVVTNEETGFIRCDMTDRASQQAGLLLDSMILGLSAVEKQYGSKYLQVRFEEV